MTPDEVEAMLTDTSVALPDEGRASWHDRAARASRHVLRVHVAPGSDVLHLVLVECVDPACQYHQRWLSGTLGVVEMSTLEARHKDDVDVEMRRDRWEQLQNPDMP